jgi:hypothetical protein
MKPSIFVKPNKPLLMRTSLINRLFFIAVVAAALFMMALRASTHPAVTSVCEKEPAVPLQAAGTQLWESLSHQFVSSVQF